MLSTHVDLSRRLNLMEKKYDSQFKIVFDAIRQLMTPPAETRKPRIGYHTEEKMRSAPRRSKKAGERPP